MRVLFINQYYHPDESATAMMLTDLAEYLAAHNRGAGDRVDVVCSRGGYTDTDQKAAARETVRGVNVYRLRAWGSRKKGSLSRGLEYLGFHLGCKAWLAMHGLRYDVIVTLTDPPLIGLHAVWMKWFSFGHVKHVHWSMDVFPEILIALGAVRERSFFAKVLGWFGRREYRSADAVVPLGECMGDLLRAKGVKEDRLRVIHVWNRGDAVTPVAHADNPLRAEVIGEGAPGEKMVVMYSGNAGRAHTFDEVQGAMERLRDDAGKHFLFVGGGAALPGVEAFAAERGLENFTKRGYFPRSDLSRSLAMGDVHLVTLRDNWCGMVVPSKLYGIMAAGRAIVYVGPEGSTIAQQVRAADCGFVVAGGDVDGLVEVIERLAGDVGLRERLGENARRWFLEHTEAGVCCGRWDALLHEVTGTARAGVVDDEREVSAA